MYACASRAWVRPGAVLLRLAESWIVRTREGLSRMLTLLNVGQPLSRERFAGEASRGRHVR